MRFSGDRDSRVICAVSTPAGYGGISVVRVSGEGAVAIVRRLAPQLASELKSHSAHFATLSDLHTKTAIDQCVFTYFEKGRSFTGEETVEISCHGNPLICDQIMQSLIAAGGLPALPGEFTYRAFMNNKLDLVQAESVLSLIESRSKKSATLAYRQLVGGLSEKIAVLESEMTWCLAHIEASIDFSTEGLETTPQNVLIKKLRSCHEEITQILQTYRAGRMLRDGVHIALVGRPNVGKSSLLNLLLGYERSIVTEIAGTTRDVVSDETQYDGQRLHFLDTAGLRKSTQDRVEKIGMQKSLETAKTADLVLFVFDLETGFLPEDEDLLKQIQNQNCIYLGNKADLSSTETKKNSLKYVHEASSSQDAEVLFCSTLDKSNQELVLKAILKRTLGDVQVENEVLIANARHFEQLSMAAEKIANAIESLEQGFGAELTSLDLKEALMGLQAILGKYFDDQIMDRVFKEFCIGK